MTGEEGKWRLEIVFLLAIFLSGSLVFRLFQKQVLEHDAYEKASAAQSTTVITQLADRGEILVSDKEGKLYSLASSEWRYQVEVSPQAVKDKGELAKALCADIAGLDCTTVMGQIDNNKIYIPPIATDLDEATANKVKDGNYRGVYVKSVLRRIYPEGATIAPQVAGFIGADAQGKYGVEAFYNEILRGQTGSTKVRQDSLGRLLDILGEHSPVQGADLKLTIDYNLQYLVETKLAEALTTYQAEKGSIIVMDPKTGAIKALAGSPKYDPNSYRTVPTEQQSLFLSQAASDAYEPGSAFKPVVMAAALNEGAVKPETTNVFSGITKVLDREIHNVDDKGYGKETMSQILENSDNVGMSWVGSVLGAVKERDYLQKFGFGAKSGIDLVGEQTGSLQDIKQWNDLLRSTAAFGQGVSVNLVQLATAYSVIANGGTLVTPHLGESTIKGDETTPLAWPTRGAVITPETASQVREMLWNVVEKGHGKRAKVDGVRVGGKTGTAQVPDPAGGYFADKHIGTFAGLFPVDDPKYVMAVRLDNPKTVQFAESSAAPTFGEIAKWMVNYYGLRP